jgi:hypothetical protein
MNALDFFRELVGRMISYVNGNDMVFVQPVVTCVALIW